MKTKVPKHDSQDRLWSPIDVYMNSNNKYHLS